MARIALLTKRTPKLEDDNYLRFARAFNDLGHLTTLFDVDQLQLHNRAVQCSGFAYTGQQPGDSFPKCESFPLDHDLVWLLSLGERASFLDKLQLLHANALEQTLINSLTAVMHYKSKYLIATHPGAFPVPETHADTNPTRLAELIRSKGGQWIAKPPAGSLGRDVFMIKEQDPNLSVILEHLCGPDQNQYAMVQRYIPEIEQGEKRVLLAGGQIIGQYLRQSNRDHRTNLTQGASAEACELSTEEKTTCERIAEFAAKDGVFFCGIDLAYPWLIETNVINPGGLITLEQLTGIDHSRRVVEIAVNQLGL